VSIRLTPTAEPGAKRRALLVTVVCGVAGSAIGLGFLWVTLGSSPAGAEKLSEGGQKLVERGAARKSERAGDAARLRQREIGEDYQFDGEGNLLGARTDATDLPKNRPLLAAVPPSPAPRAEIAEGVTPRGPGPVEGAGPATPGRSEDDGDRAAVSQPMLGYSTVRGATWAARRPEAAGEVPSRQAGPQPENDQEERLLGMLERSLPGGSAPTGTEGTGPARPGAGDALYPAQRAPQPFLAGGVGDMRIGGRVGPDQIVRQGKFLDCALVNELRVDLVESPVVAMVSRDFVSLDGAQVLVPAGAKLLGAAGQVGNLQQARVYVRFDRIIFPDQRSAYFPTRQVSAVDGAGAIGIPGNVDRHFLLQFGAAIMLGVLDGLAAAVEAPGTGTNPGVRELVTARTSTNFSAVVAGILGRYANVVPTVTVEPGAKLKVFFVEDVWLSPYMRTADLSWVRGPRR
jgi:type IV secretory pathway VirB10-like protein